MQPDGLSQESKDKRRLLLAHNGQEVTDILMNSDMDNPVGFIIEMTDPKGKEITYAILESEGMAKSDIAETIAALSRNAIPTFKVLLPMKSAKRILSIISPTAIANLSPDRIPGNRFIVIIGGGGNSYVQVPGYPV